MLLGFLGGRRICSKESTAFGVIEFFQQIEATSYIVLKDVDLPITVKRTKNQHVKLADVLIVAITENILENVDQEHVN